MARTTPAQKPRGAQRKTFNEGLALILDPFPEFLQNLVGAGGNPVKMIGPLPKAARRRQKNAINRV
jgi:hypothetical protein